jgi:RHS repeat-associated protein
VVSDAQQTPLTGVAVTMTGKDGNGNSTGCTGSTVSDAAGNFTLSNLPALCLGPQLVGFNGTTVTSPAGAYAGVNLAFTFTASQVTTSPVLIHLPRIDNAETFLVQQNSASDQSYSFTSIPGLAVTVYAGTTFTMPDGTQPNPFPLSAVSVPVDRLPDVKPPVPTMLTAFIVAFQPANVTASQPVAVYYPNSLNTPPGTDATLLTLDPTHGVMVPYGTGAVSNDGTQFIPDLDPAHPGHRYGLVHFDWHMVGTPPGNQANPCGIPPCPCSCDPVDFSSGLAVIHETDISYGGARGTISITRTYRSGANQPIATDYGPFGYGTNHNWGYELDSVSPSTASVINLIMPDGNRYAFSKQASGTFVNSGIPAMGGGVMTVNGGNVSLRWKDGTTFGFIVIFNVPTQRTLLDSVTDANGNRFQITHNGFQIQAITDATGRSMLFNYNNGGHITQITAPDGTNASYNYRGNSGPVLRQVRRTDGSIVQYSYDNNNSLTSVTDNTGAVFASNTYDANGRVIQQRTGDGGVWQFAYTLQNPLAGLLSPVLATTVTDPLGKQTIYRFSPNGALIGVTDALGQMRTVSRDGGNYIVGYSGSGACAQCGDPRAGDETFAYDDSTGNLLSHTDALANTTTFTYEPNFGKVTSIKDALGDTTSFTYDTHGNLLTQTDPNGNVTSYIYDSFGELIQTIDPTGQSTGFGYGAFGNIANIYDPVGNITSLQYDGNGRLTQSTDPLGRRTSMAYDGSGRITSQTNAQAATTSFVYDTRGNLLSATDGRGNTTLFTYDLENQLLTRQDGLGTGDTRTYDLAGNLTTFLDRRGQTSTFNYDAINRLTGESYQDGSTVARAYDANSRLINVNDSAGGVFTFAFDPAGRLTKSATPYGAIGYTRDALGRAATRQVMGQAAVAYAYDKAGNLLSASTPAAGISRTYDARNLLATATRMNGVSSQYAYDPLGRLTSLTHTAPAGTLSSLTYGYDAVGNRSSATSTVAQSLITTAVTPASYDGDNEQLQFGAATNTFDASGNLASSTASGNTTAYSWDSRGRLLSVSAPNGQTTSFTYDFAGNLIQQKDSGPVSSVTQTFLLDSLTNVAGVNRSDGDSYSVLAGRSIDDHIAVVHGNGQIEYVLPDGLNSTVVTADQTGAVKGRFAYEPFGQTTATGSSYPFQYAGRVPVSAGLYYYRARFYDVNFGRFISEDPTGIQNGPNLYSYAGNDPSNAIDPTGQFILVVGTLAGAAIGGGAEYLFGSNPTVGSIEVAAFGGAVLGAAALLAPGLAAGVLIGAGVQAAIEHFSGNCLSSPDALARIAVAGLLGGVGGLVEPPALGILAGVATAEFQSIANLLIEGTGGAANKLRQYFGQQGIPTY